MKTFSPCLNRIITPSWNLRQFILFASQEGFSAVELRNDLEGLSIDDDMQSEQLCSLAQDAHITLATINALQRFNDTDTTLKTRLHELEILLKIGKQLNMEAIVLCPINGVEPSEAYHQQTVASLEYYGPLFEAYGMLGYVEPLGFACSSLRTKKEAVLAIQESGYAHCYKLVHDTFHHYLAQETEFFPELTGIIHISGVIAQKERDAILDADRILLTSQDITRSKQQVEILLEGGFSGYVSFEPFAKEIQDLDEHTLSKQLQSSLQTLRH